VWPPGSGGLGSTPGSSVLLVHAVQLSAYSDINICDRPLELGLRAPGPLVQASVGITDEAGSGTISSAQPQRNPTYRPARKIIGTSPSMSPPCPLHTLHTCTASKKVAVAAHHLHLDTLPSPHSSLSGRACALVHLNWPQRCLWHLDDGCQDGMVWCGYKLLAN